VAGRRTSPVGRSRLDPAALLSVLLVAGTLTAIAASASATTTGSPATTTPTTAQAPTATSTTAPASPADRLVLNAITAEERLGSVHIEGKVTQGKRVIVLDLLVNGDGEGGGVFVQQGNVIKVERVGTLLYFNAPKRYWAARSSAAETKAYGGKWIELPANDTSFVSFDEFLDAADLADAAFHGATAPLTVGKPTTFAGHRVVVVKDTVTTKGKRLTGSMYIATASPHYVYKIVDETSGETSTLVFNHYGKAVTLAVPPEAINVS
jgi:hypothetical protein